MDDQSVFLLMIFLVALLMAWAFVEPIMGSSGASRRRLRRRIRELSREGLGAQHISMVRGQYLKKLSPFEQRLEALPLMDRVGVLIYQAGYSYPAHRVVLTSLGAGVVTGFVAWLWSGLGVQAIAFGLVFATLPFFSLSYKRRSRMAAFEEQLPDGLSAVSRCLKAGLPFSQAMRIASEEMEGPVGKEFGTVFVELNYGGDVRTALLGLLDRMPTIAIMATVAAILIQRETGGNLAEVLSRIEKLVRERFRFQRTLKTLTAQNRMSAWAVSLMPFVLAALLELQSPGWMSDLTQDPSGQSLLTAAFVMMVVGILWLRRMVRLDV